MNNATKSTVGPLALFIGDSITDAGRRSDPSGFLGAGYVRRLHEMLIADQVRVEVANRGVSGDRVRDLRRRWQSDCIDLRPQILTVLIGVNDMWRRYDSGDPTTAGEFQRDYTAVLDQAVDSGITDIVVMEPFLVPVDEQQTTWGREDLDAKRAVAREVAVAAGALFVPLHERMNELARAQGTSAAVEDGVHPSAGGHQLIATAWREQTGPLLHL